MLVCMHLGSIYPDWCEVQVCTVMGWRSVMGFLAMPQQYRTEVYLLKIVQSRTAIRCAVTPERHTTDHVTSSPVTLY